MSTRTKVIAGLALLVALWAAAAVPALTEAVQVMSARVTANHLGRPIGALVLSLEAERRLSAGDRAAGSELAAQRGHTDQARQALQAARDTWIKSLAGSDSLRQADDLLSRTGELAGVRSAVDDRQLSHDRAVDAYTALIDPAGVETPTVFPDQLAGSAAGLSALSRSRELLAEEDAQLAAVAGATKLTDADRVRLSTLAGARRSLFASAGTDLPADSLDRYRELAGDTGLTTVESALLRGTGEPDTAAWSAAYNRLNTALWELQNSANREAAGAATAHAVLTVVRAGVVGGVGLIAVIGVLLVARRSGNRATTGGEKRRPAAGRAGDDPRPRLDPLLRDLERRNQGLLHRQLRLLDTLARRESDDETLGDLFRADHLANRMRRNLEKSITLAGGTPGRRWRRPVPLAEVVRAAASEITEYGRVSTSQVEAVQLDGVAVTDLMHLLAELIENATTFAPAETRVRVTGANLATGYRLTITDVGPGMTEDDLATAAQVMADPVPPPSGTWWGLYSVGRFAARRNITVTLHNGLDGGLAVEVTVPAALISPATDEEPTLGNPTLDDPTLDDLESVING
ncbi:nitrate- and nitrite sensing domain-containing protein [Actinoplanes sp. NPDC051343]|uniref:sensor histidine kinase n=1 Tax=Actinoplanes sp. NPDC051343 TaxID=3363906 RepID=UPI0037B0C398